MHRRRLMQTADDRLEVVDRQRPGIVIAVPADHVPRMMIHDYFGQHVVLLDHQAEFALLIMDRQRLGPANVTLAIGAVFEELASFVAVTRGRTNGSGTFD